MTDNNKMSRSLSWTVGFSVALGVPLLIVPSIEYFAIYVGTASILIWAISVFEGFVQNTAYGEMVVDNPDCSGIPGCAQKIMGQSGNAFAKFTGGFSSWGYWFAWAPLPSIFSLSITDLIISILPETGISRTAISFVVGAAVLCALFGMNYRGLQSSAVVGYIMNILSLVPLAIIALVPMFVGKADFSILQGSWLPEGFHMDSLTIILIFGLFGMAQWSACAWETAAIYGPEYKNPTKDTPKALFACGIVCFIFFVMIQLSCVTTIGAEGLRDLNEPAMLAMARIGLGNGGAIIAAIVMIVAMFSIMQTGFSGASRAMHSMSVEGNLPAFFGKLNKHGMPAKAMIAIMILNMVLIIVGSASALVAASSVGYGFANGIALISYIIHKRKKNKEEEKGNKAGGGFSMPRWWYIPIAVFAVLNITVFVVGLVYLNYLDNGWFCLLLCAIILIGYIPLYKACHHDTVDETEELILRIEALENDIVEIKLMCKALLENSQIGRE